jgi:hypothetical protein
MSLHRVAIHDDEVRSEKGRSGMVASAEGEER